MATRFSAQVFGTRYEVYVWFKFKLTYGTLQWLWFAFCCHFCCYLSTDLFHTPVMITITDYWDWREWVSGWVSEWMSGCVSGCVSEWVSEWVDEWMREWMREWVSEWMSGCVSEWMSGWVSQRHMAGLIHGTTPVLGWLIHVYKRCPKLKREITS